MTIRTPTQYVEGLRDGRRVFYRGEGVKDVTANVELRLAVDHSSLAYSISQSHPELAVDVEGEEHFSAFYRIPRSARDLRERGALIEQVAALGAGVIVLKEVGSDALFALLRATEGDEQAKARAFYDRVRRDDLALAVAQTDVKGDRTKAPHEQSDPDLYLRIVDEDAEFDYGARSQVPYILFGQCRRTNRPSDARYGTQGPRLCRCFRNPNRPSRALPSTSLPIRQETQAATVSIIRFRRATSCSKASPSSTMYECPRNVCFSIENRSGPAR